MLGLERNENEKKYRICWVQRERNIRKSLGYAESREKENFEKFQDMLGLERKEHEKKSRISWFQRERNIRKSLVYAGSRKKSILRKNLGYVGSREKGKLEKLQDMLGQERKLRNIEKTSRISWVYSERTGFEEQKKSKLWN